MKVGKISQNILNRSVEKPIRYRSPQLLLKPALGQDCGLLTIHDDAVIAGAVNPVMGWEDDVMPRGFYRSCNDILCGGATPVAVMVDLLLPSSCEEKKLKQMMQQLAQLAEQHKIDILGGHTQVTEVVTEPVVSVTCLGEKRQKKGQITALQLGMELVMTGTVGATGAKIQMTKNPNGVRERFGEDFVERVECYGSQYGCYQEIHVIMSEACGNVALHNGSESGIFAALWEMGELGKVGFSVDLKALPIRQETIEVCEYFDENPYTISSEGTLLIGTSQGEALVEALMRAGCAATVIGQVTDNRDRVVIHGEERRFLTPSGK